MSPQTGRWKTALDEAGALQQRLATLTATVAATPELAAAVRELAPALTALQQAQAEYDVILQGLADGVTVYDADARLVYMNDAAARAGGYASADEVQQRHAAGALLDKFDLFDEGGQPFPLDQLPSRRVLRGESVPPVTLCYRHQETGAVRWMRVRAEPALDEAGQLRFAVVHMHDVTVRRQTETALRESQERYRNLFEYSPISLWEEDFSETQACLDDLRRQGVTDFDAYLAAHPETVAECMRLIRVLDVNQATVRLFGARSKAELLGQVSRVFGPETQTVMAYELAALARGARECEAEGVNYRLTGERLDVFVRWVMPPGLAAPAARILVSIDDITQRKQAEAARLASEAQFRTYVEHSPVGIFVVSAAGYYLDANPAACALTGFSRDELIGRFIPGLAMAEGPETVRQFATLLDRGTFRGEASLSRKDGSTLPVIIDAVRLPGDRYMAYCTDIAERKQVETALQAERARLAQRVEARTAELRAANEELTRAMQAKDEFLALMSHELRTPLTSILGLSESLQLETYGPLSDRQKRSLRTIHASGEHLLALITDVLDLASLGTGQLDLQFELVAVPAICQACLRLMAPQALHKNIHVTSTLDSAVTTLRADVRRLKQMLINLLSNAIKFTPEGGQLGLEVTGNAEQQLAYFTVWDTGIGISAENLQRLFQPFEQVDSSLARRYEGAGVGLALVRRLAELHGGSVTAQSEVGQGSRFTLALPWKPGLLPPARPAAAQLPASPAAGTLVLLVDDSPLIVSAFTDVLQAQGYQVVTAGEGAAALELARARRPALVLMDIQMPGLNGLDAIRQLRADSELAALPVIALTALVMPGDRERCLAAGADEYMSKPVRWPDLLDTMARLLKGHPHASR